MDGFDGDVGGEEEDGLVLRHGERPRVRADGREEEPHELEEGCREQQKRRNPHDADDACQIGSVSAYEACSTHDCSIRNVRHTRL